MFRLPNPRQNEEIIYLLRRHWFVTVPLMIGLILVIGIPVGSYAFLNWRDPAFFAAPVRLTLFILGASIFFLYAWLFLYQNFIDWYLDIWIVTNERIVNIEQNGLFGRTMSELMLYNVQDVTSEVKGIVPTLLDFGHVHVQTAGEVEHFDFENVPHPAAVAKRVLEFAAAHRANQQPVASSPAAQ